jgi:hypothetical protein
MRFYVILISVTVFVNARSLYLARVMWTECMTSHPNSKIHFNNIVASTYGCSMYYLPFKCSDYMEPVIGAWTCTELSWSDIDRERLKYSEGTLFQGKFVHLKCHVDWSGSESELLRRADGALPSEKWHDSLFSKIRDYSIYILVSTRICMKHLGCVVVSTTY